VYAGTVTGFAYLVHIAALRAILGGAEAVADACAGSRQPLPDASGGDAG